MYLKYKSNYVILLFKIFNGFLSLRSKCWFHEMIVSLHILDLPLAALAEHGEYRFWFHKYLGQQIGQRPCWWEEDPKALSEGLRDQNYFQNHTLNMTYFSHDVDIYTKEQKEQWVKVVVPQL